MLVDSHAHLQFSEYGESLLTVIERASMEGVEKIICVGTSIEDSEAGVRLAQEQNLVWATVGIHPNDDLEITAELVDWENLKRLAQNPKVVGIGECGLDYSRGLDQERQRGIFDRQVELATELALPLVVHIRDAQEDLILNFGDKLSRLEGVFHCFSGDEKYLKFILNELPGFRISFAGNITFKNAGQLRELAKTVPLERLIVETDSPFLAPEPQRGTRNEPANVKIVAQYLAPLLGTTFEEVCQATTENAIKLFQLNER